MQNQVTRKPMRRMTNADRAAIARAEQAARLEAFETNRRMIWTKLWALAQTLALAKAQCPAFLEEQDLGVLPGLTVDVIKNTIRLTGGVGGVEFSFDTLTPDTADRLDRELGFLASEFDSFQRTEQRYAIEREKLIELRREALDKLSAAEQMALGVYKITADDHSFRTPKQLRPYEREILEAVMPKTS